jgi:hypothetical protein
MVGKITPDTHLSCSRLPAVMGLSPWSTPNDELAKSVDARLGRDRQRDTLGEAADWGNLLEPIVLQEMARRLGLVRVQTGITKPVQAGCMVIDGLGAKHGMLYGSLDGRGTAPEVWVADTNPGLGIYCPAGPVKLVGRGVLEAKTTRREPTDAPPLYQGPVQVQGLMLCTGYQWAAVGVLHQGQELRIYLYQACDDWWAKIRDAVVEFETRLQGPDWYPPVTAADARRTWQSMDEDAPPIALPAEAADLARMILDGKRARKAVDEMIDQAEAGLMSMLGNHEVGQVEGITVRWPSKRFKAQPEKVVPATPERVTRGSLYISEVVACPTPSA